MMAELTNLKSTKSPDRRIDGRLRDGWLGWLTGRGIRFVHRYRAQIQDVWPKTLAIAIVT